MRIEVGSFVVWTAPDDVAGAAPPAAMQTSDEAPFLALGPVPGASYEVLSDPRPVEAGRAYRCTVSVSPSLSATHAELGLVWSDGEGREVGRVRGPFVFMVHALAEEIIGGLAPARAEAARLAVRVVSDQTIVRRSSGQVLVGAPRIEHSLSLMATPIAEAALYGADCAASYRLRIVGAPHELAEAKVLAVVTDYEGRTTSIVSALVPLVGGAGEATLTLPAQESGYFRVEISATAEGLAPGVTTQSYGFLPPLEFDVPADYPIGLDAGMSWPTGESRQRNEDHVDPERLSIKCAVARRLGLRTLRDRWSWAETNPVPGQYALARYVQTARAQREAGLDVFQINHSTPAWAQVPAPEDASHTAYAPRDPRDYYRAIRQMLRETGGAIRFFEPWNEPDIFFFQGYVWDLVALSKAAYLACKDEDPGVGVLSASRCAEARFWEVALENGLAPYVEIFNQHSYGTPEGLFALLEEDRALLAPYGPPRPLWMSEMGRRTDPDPDGRYVQAERQEVSYLLRSYACGLAAGIDRFFYFYLQEFLEYGIWLWGILRSDLSCKPTVLALATLIRQLREARPVGMVRQGETYAVVFRRAEDDYVALAWSLEGGTMEFPVGPHAFLVDGVGRTVQELHRKRVSLTLSEQPVFVRRVDASAMTLEPIPHTPRYAPSAASAPEALRVWLQVVARPGQPWPDFRSADWSKSRPKVALECASGSAEELGLWVHNYAPREVRVSLSVELPVGWELLQAPERSFTVAPDASREERLRLRVGALTAGEPQGVTVRLALDGQPRDVARVYYAAP